MSSVLERAWRGPFAFMIALSAVSTSAARAQQASTSAPVGIPAQSSTETAPTPAPTTKTTPTATSPAAASPAAAPAAPGSWASTISLGLQFEGGATLSPERPSNGIDYGRLFDDKANTFLLNQVQATATRPINSSAAGYDIGFTLQATYGSDGRYIHYLGELDDLTQSRYQLSLLQANVLLHTPWLTAGGIDWKLGQFLTPFGYETIDPSTNPFYSHSYIFNFGGPFLHTGLQAVWHYNATLDVYAQIDTGENTTFGSEDGDDNGEAAGLVGFGLNNLLNGNLTVLSLAHLGPENPLRSDPQANSQMRYESDTVVTYKVNPKLTSVTELNVQHDDGFGADAYGASTYLSYTLTPVLTLNGRAEVYRDNAGFFVLAFPDTQDFANALSGKPNTAFTVGRATYSEYTVGITYKPTVKPLALLAFRPEIRWDKTLSGTSLFVDHLQTNYVTLAADVIVGF